MRNAKFPFTYVCVGFVLLINILSRGAIAESATADNNTSDSQIRSEFMDSQTTQGGPFFSETTAENFVHKFGIQAVPVLIGLLKEDISPRIKGKIAFYLGKVKTDDDTTTHPAIKPLINLVNITLNKEIGENEEFMLRYVMYGLGFTGQKEAIKFLKDFVFLKSWERRSISPFGNKGTTFSTRDRMIFILRSDALAGIATAGNQDAISTLANLKSDPVNSDINEDIDRWIVQCKDNIKRAMTNNGATKH